MSSNLRSVKDALKALLEALGLEPLHKAKPKLWQNLNEFIKNYRDFFVHPNPDKFHEYMSSASDKSWGFASETVEGILGYIFFAKTGSVPSWVRNSELTCLGFQLVDI